MLMSQGLLEAALSVPLESHLGSQSIQGMLSHASCIHILCMTSFHYHGLMADASGWATAWHSMDGTVWMTQHM